MYYYCIYVNINSIRGVRVWTSVFFSGLGYLEDQIVYK